MADRVYTPMQQLAIDTRDKTLLVSAAAGSGKTATLTERIIRSVTDEKNPIDINSILVVTFTNSAAGELRERIGKAVRAAIAKRPDDARLARQLHLLPGATIATIDSFLSDVLRSNAERVGISPSFRIADEAEARLMCETVLEGLINSVFMGQRDDVATADEFSALCDALSDSKSVRGLTDVFETVYENLISSEAGVDTLLPIIELYKSEAELPVGER
ncbi:MAG: UvrD-helicase domain-containing protein, partial [Clostridia bacterium]|nr:UvrD-helicase domain-containing protein [Clostridia bacterium]